MRKTRLLRFNKPFGVLCQFTDAGGRPTLADFVSIPGVYAAGRLDADSEGLLLLTNDGPLQHRIADPRLHLPKTYRVQVEGEPSPEALERLRRGVGLRDGPARAVAVQLIAAPVLWPRHPPIRLRKRLPTAWLEIVLAEGRNRQLRRMTAAIGHPTLRLVRVAIGPWSLGDLKPGEWAEAEVPPRLAAGGRASLDYRRPGGRSEDSRRPGAPRERRDRLAVKAKQSGRA